MSHFTVAVIHDSQITQEVLRNLLQPFHEYECTGIEDQYVRFVPHDEKLLKESYEKYKEEGESFDEWCESQHYVKEGGVWGRRTNPDKQWDWWVLGGRWSGMLKLKPGAIGEVGERSLMHPTGMMNAEPPSRIGFDLCRVGDLDLERMKKEKVDSRRKEIDRVFSHIRNETCFTRQEVFDKWRTFVELREQEWKKFQEYRDSTAVENRQYKDFASWIEYTCSDEFKTLWKLPVRLIGDAFIGSAIPESIKSLDELEQYIEQTPALTTFAVLKDGKWYERGSMGWWGVVSDEKDYRAWGKEYDDLLKSLTPDHWIAIVDCHI